MNSWRSKIIAILRPILIYTNYTQLMPSSQRRLHAIAQWGLTVGILMVFFIFLLAKGELSPLLMTIGGGSFVLILGGLITINVLVSNAVTKAHRMDQDLEVARRIQLKLLPLNIPQSPTFDITAFYYPAEDVGGDFFDFLPIDDYQLGIVIGDVSGKGMTAALYMAQIKGMLSLTAATHPQPKPFLLDLDRALKKSLDRGRFVTLLYAVLDLQEGMLSFARAGHEGLLYLSQSNGVVEACDILRPPGMGIAALDSDKFEITLEEWSFAPSAGDILVFYTDGISEAMNPHKDEFGEERIRDIVREHAHQSASEIANAMLDALQDFTGTEPQHDDMTLIVLKFRE